MLLPICVRLVYGGGHSADSVWEWLVSEETGGRAAAEGRTFQGKVSGDFPDKVSVNPHPLTTKASRTPRFLLRAFGVRS